MGNSGAKSNTIIIVLVASGFSNLACYSKLICYLFFDIVHIETVLFRMYMD